MRSVAVTEVRAVSDFKVQALEQLTDQVRFAPPGVRQEQLERAEVLMGQVRPERSYPYQFVVYRITNYRSDGQPNLLIPGEDLRHDLDLFLERVARTLQTGLELPAEPMFSLEQVSKQLNVSTKTVSRWRKHGLIGQQVMQNGRKQLAFSQSVVERFVAAHPREAARGSKFSHLSMEEKDEIIRKARHLANVGGSLTDVSKRIAHTLGRSPEAVRYTIKNHDRVYPGLAVFPNANGRLNPDAKLQIFNSYRKGIAVETLAKQFHRTRSSIHKVINEVKADKLLKAPVDYIPNPEFDDPARAADILGPMPDEEGFQEQLRNKKVPRDVPPEMAHLYEYPLLTREQEAHLFRQMNYLKHQLHGLHGDLAPSRARSQDIDRIEELQAKIGFVRDRLIRCNMRLVVNYAKKHAGPADNLWELISDGNMSLLRAVEKFDYGRGNKFSTYASWAIMKNFARSIPDEKTRRERFMTGHEEVFDAKADIRSDEQEQLTQAEQANRKVNRLLDILEPREREILRMRAGLDNEENLTLEEIGRRMGITKERVRQLNVRIMKKLREYVQQHKMDM
jgi:RNA polymerase primary sigma factor